MPASARQCSLSKAGSYLAREGLVLRFLALTSIQAGPVEGSGLRMSHSPHTLPVTQRCQRLSPVLV